MPAGRRLQVAADDGVGGAIANRAPRISGTPGIEYRNARSGNVFDVTRHHGQVVVQGGGRKQAVSHRQAPSRSLCPRRKPSPPVGHTFIDGQNAACKPYRQLPVQPRSQSHSAGRIGQRDNPHANFTHGKHAQMEQHFVGCFHPGRHPSLRLPPYQFGDHIRIQQKSAHSLTLRPKSGLRFRFNLTRARGDSAKNCTRLCGWRARANNRSNSSAGRITTASFSCRVTNCGPSERARRKTSLN